MNYTSLDETVLLGKTIKSISHPDNDRIEIETSDGKRYVMLHHQDCCESVGVHDIVGDLQSIVGSPITVSRAAISSDWPKDVPDRSTESFTWTTYFFETATAKVTIRWFGESNGCYSESVEFEERN